MSLLENRQREMDDLYKQMELDLAEMIARMPILSIPLGPDPPLTWRQKAMRRWLAVVWRARWVIAHALGIDAEHTGHYCDGWD